MGYEHTQRSWLGWILTAAGFCLMIIAMLFTDRTVAGATLFMVTLVLLFASLFFSTLTVRDAGDHLSLTFGPVPVFRAYIVYSEISGVDRARSSLLDGWGIHYIPWRGWTYNIWGFKCVRIRMAQGAVRVGTNDQDALVALLEKKIDTGR
ncbi:MAG: hypothetical protein GY737_29165 [Desulfobacteraceae bacterium]|nr:hypothetical protein [Desulfobacteraceae bacterium]